MFRTAKAFSLVELLVVIAIISVLAAMLLPSVEASLTMGRVVSCADNLRQTGATLVSYTGDCRDALPPNVATYNDVWPYRAYATYPWDNTKPNFMGYVAIAGHLPTLPAILYCPEDVNGLKYMSIPARWPNGCPAPSGVSISYADLPYGTWNASYTTVIPKYRKLSQIPNGRVVLYDAVRPNHLAYDNMYRDNTNFVRHKPGIWSILHPDMHVESRASREAAEYLYLNGVYNASWTDVASKYIPSFTLITGHSPAP